jgi:cytoskeletal protein CcmA (bactofilin family)
VAFAGGTVSASGGAANNLSLNSRNQFRENARVLRDGTDGPDTFHNDLSIAGFVGISGGAIIYNDASPQNTLGVSGRTTLGQPGWSPGDPNGLSYNALEVYGKTKLFADISVSTSGSFEGSLSAGGDLAVLGNMTVGKVLDNGTRVDGNARFWGSLTASTVSAFSGSITTDLTVGDDLRVGDDLAVTGDAYVMGTMSIGKTTPVSGFALDVVGAARSSVSTTDASNGKTLVTKDYVDSKFSVSISSIKTAARGHPNFSGAPYGGNYNEIVPNGESWLMLWFLDGGWSTSDSDNESFRIGAKLSGTQVITGNGVTKFGDFLWSVVSTNGGVSLGGSHAIYFKVS